MNQKVFVQKSDEKLDSMNTEELRSCLHNIARKIPENKREAFLQLLNACCNQKDRKENDKKIQFKRIIPDEKVKCKLSDLKVVFSKIEEGELCISAEGYEDYSNGYWESDWVWKYEDRDGVGKIIEDAVLFAHDCISDCRYKEAVEIFRLVMETPISVDDEIGGDSFELKLEEMVDEKLAGINLKLLALDVLYSHYQIQSVGKRASTLYSFFTYPYFKDIHIEDIFSIGREELKDTDLFFESWIDFLMKQNGENAARLLKEGVLYYKGTEGLLEIARKGYKEHPSAYFAVLLEYEKVHDYEKMKEVGRESLGRLASDLKIRGEVAMKAAQAAYYVNDSEFMRKCWYEAFYSNSSVSNYLRLFSDKEVINEYKDLAEKRIASLVVYDRYSDEDESETTKNNVRETEYKYLCFFTGYFDRVQKWCMEQKNPLGWSGNFIGYGLDLMLLYLYSDNNLRKALRKIAARVANRMGFNEGKNIIFIKANSVFENQVSTQKSEEIFWNIFCLWKSNYEISVNDKNSNINWMEDVIGKRVDAIVGGKFRNKYEDVALLIAALGEVKNSLGEKMAKSIVVNKYLNKYPRHTSFRGALKEYID